MYFINMYIQHGFRLKNKFENMKDKWESNDCVCLCLQFSIIEGKDYPVDLYQTLHVWMMSWSLRLVEFPYLLNSRGGRDSRAKGAGMIVISFRGVNYGFGNHLGCSQLNTNIFSHQSII